MPRKKLVRTSAHPYHITARGNNREIFPLRDGLTWYIFCAALKKIQERYQVKIHAFVMMPNHFHLLASTPKEDLGVVMEYFMRSVTKTINSASGRSGRIFGGPYDWSLVTEEVYYYTALKYIFRNPVKAGITQKVEDYRFSSLNPYKPLPFLIAPLVESQISGFEIERRSFFDWLNIPTQPELDKKIMAGFKKAEFKIPKSTWKSSSAAFIDYGPNAARSLI